MTQQQMDLVYSLYLMTMQTQPITVLCTVYCVLLVCIFISSV